MSNVVAETVLNLLTEASKARLSNLSRSIELAQEALNLATRNNDLQLIAKSLTQLSLFYMIHGDYPLAIETAEKAIVIYEQLNDEKGVADAKFTIASVYYKTDNSHLGLKYLIDCIVIFRKYNDYFNQARTLKSMGTIYEFFGDVENAVLSYEEAIIAADAAKDLNLKSNVYNPLSGIYLNRGELDKAKQLIEESLALKQQTGDIRGAGFAYYGRGKIYTCTKQFDLAEADFQKSLQIHIDAGEKLGEIMTYHKIGVMYMEMGDDTRAIEMLEKTKELSSEHNVMFINIKCKYLLYTLYKKQGNTEKALYYLERHHERKEKFIQNQTLQVIRSYEMILDMESKLIEKKMELEKNKILEEKRKAQAIAKAKQDFLSTMSHEIRTPLNAVITITHLLNEKYKYDDNQLLESLKFASNNLLYLINDILDFTKLESGKVELTNRPVLIKPLLENIKNTYNSLAEEKGIALELYADENMHDCYEMDETKISQILGNLLSNAIKFTEKGKIVLSAKSIQQSASKDTIRIAVKDTGMGIAPDFIDTIFDSFTQAKNPTTKKEHGSGLGLAIVKKLAELHGSEVHIESTVNKGSTFYFDLLLKKAAVPTVLKTSESKQLSDLTVLLAEDNAINTLVATRLLSRWGVQVDHATNGVEAVAKAKKKRYDAILMDIHMPEMNGYEATETIRSTKNLNSATPVYALTADVYTEISEKHANHFKEVLRKPIEIDQLYKVLSALA